MLTTRDRLLLGTGPPPSGDPCWAHTQPSAHSDFPDTWQLFFMLGSGLGNNCCLQSILLLPAGARQLLEPGHSGCAGGGSAQEHHPRHSTDHPAPSFPPLPEGTKAFPLETIGVKTPNTETLGYCCERQAKSQQWEAVTVTPLLSASFSLLFPTDAGGSQVLWLHPGYGCDLGQEAEVGSVLQKAPPPQKHRQGELPQSL